jgi:hypothetical protein
MARKFTGKEWEFTKVIEGATGRLIARRALRRTLGNPKKRSRDLAEMMFEMYQKGVNQGRQLENARITYSTVGLEYGEGYPVTQTEAAEVCSDPESDGSLALPVDYYNDPNADYRDIADAASEA